MLNLPLNIWILALTSSLTTVGATLLILVGGLIGAKLAPNPGLATLPIAAYIVGTAILTIPAALLNQKLGRKAAGYLGLCFVFASSVLSIFALHSSSFFGFVASSVLTGAGSAFFQQFRFAAIESLDDPELAGPALSLMLLFTLVGALIGPEIAALGRTLLSELSEYTGSYALLSLCILIAMVVFSLFKNPELELESEQKPTRQLTTIARQPVFIVSVLSATIGFAVMSFLMTSTPLSMHQHHGFSLADSKWVIQSHMAAMFLPSLFSGFLVKKIGAANLMVLGCLLYFAVVIFALSGQNLMHYWWALVALGVGWNFLFLSGTTLLPKSYQHAERFKVQAANDFSVFGAQAIASLSAAWVLTHFGWNAQAIICLPLTLIVLICALVYRRFC